ncbi:CapA family protein [Fervidibacillus albus]|uniref:CapA family protein n=1 Tax=Fervidibacillus albus TaxID=2980026 RepID=A0A9E8LWC6_9BACI|nr:CapA family protein [Fervidibacillus albus]WAA10900.1 CapA family protein [Fervidibacillus albus]
MRKGLIFSSLLIVFIGSIILIFTFQRENQIEAHVQVASNKAKQMTEPVYKTWEETAVIGGIGDILIHDWVYEDAETKDGYDFKPMFEPIKFALQEPDLLMANQETVLGGVELGLSSYPTFNSPYEVGDALIDSGVDIVSTANNHTLDRGEKAIQNAIQYYERVGLPYVGHFKNFEDQETIRVLNKNGIRFAFLSYTYGTNGIPVPEGKEYLVNLIDLEKMKEEIERAKQEADVVVMSIHWGNEYQRYPSDEQQLIANELAQSGVDIIFGHHPHVLQPFEWIETENGRVFVAYSLGNFISGQMRNYKDIGGVVSLQVTKKVTGDGVDIQLSNPEFQPTYVSNVGLKNYRVVPLEEAGDYGLQQAEEKYEEIMDHMFQWIE